MLNEKLKQDAHDSEVIEGLEVDSKPLVELEDEERSQEVVEIPKEEAIRLERIVTAATNKAVRVAIKGEMFSGPLPKPEHLKQYGAILPSAPQDILNEFKANGKHVRECEKLALKGAIARDLVSQIFALLLAVLAIGLAIWMTILGHDKVAIALIVLTGSGLVIPFLGFKSKKKTETSDKDDE